jgi:predicted nucleotide-binding protein (sugar kinase/HSP70/actin superfamily)
METELQNKDRYINDIKEVYEQDILKLRKELQSATHTMDEAVNKLYKAMEENEKLVKQNIELMGFKEIIKGIWAGGEYLNNARATLKIIEDIKI